MISGSLCGGRRLPMHSAKGLLKAEPLVFLKTTPFKASRKRGSSLSPFACSSAPSPTLPCLKSSAQVKVFFSRLNQMLKTRDTFVQATGHERRKGSHVRGIGFPPPPSDICRLCVPRAQRGGGVQALSRLGGWVGWGWGPEFCRLKPGKQEFLLFPPA